MLIVFSAIMFLPSVVWYLRKPDNPLAAVCVFVFGAITIAAALIGMIEKAGGGVTMLHARCDRVGNGLPGWVARYKQLGNAVVPQQAYPIFKSIATMPEVLP